MDAQISGSFKGFVMPILQLTPQIDDPSQDTCSSLDQALFAGQARNNQQQPCPLLRLNICLCRLQPKKQFGYAVYSLVLDMHPNLQLSCITITLDVFL
jgi:hypothetical protein